MSADSLDRSGLSRRAPARATAAHSGIFGSSFFVPSEQDPAVLTADPLFGEWDALALRAGTTPFLRPQWTVAWCRAFARAGEQLALWNLRRNGRLAVLLPMLHRGRELRGAMNHHTPQGGMLADGADDAEALLGAMLRTTQAHHVILPALDPFGGDVDTAHRAAAGTGHAVLSLPHENACYLPTDSSWNAYELRLGRELKRDLRRDRRRLQQIGTVSFDIHTCEAGLPEALDDAFKLEDSGWKLRSGTAICSDARVEGFYRDVARWSAGEGMLRLCFLRLNGSPISMLLALEYRGTWHLLKTGYDPCYRQTAPGKVLQYECIRHCFDAGMSRIEFCGDMETHKLRWNPHSRVLQRLHLFPPSVPGQLARLRVAAHPRLKSWYARLAPWRAAQELPQSGQGVQ